MIVELNKIFASGAVFAENKPVRLFGTGAGQVCASLCGNTARGTFGGGKWVLELPPLIAGGPYELIVELNGEKRVLEDVYVGEVYLVAGQSNAEFRLCESNTSATEYESLPLLRNFFVDRPWVKTDALSSSLGWTSAKADSVGEWSAIGYLAGREMLKRHGKPVGIISCFQGGSVIESWLPPQLAAVWRLPDEQVLYDHWCDEFRHFNGNGVIFESMLSEITPYSVSKVIWYQGESDTTAAEAAVYGEELKQFFAVVRALQRDPALGFAVVQIADFDGCDKPRRAGWESIQRAQRQVAEADVNARLVVSRDICESAFIHPPTKTLLSARICDALDELCGQT